MAGCAKSAVIFNKNDVFFEKIFLFAEVFGVFSSVFSVLGAESGLTGAGCVLLSVRRRRASAGPSRPSSVHYNFIVIGFQCAVRCLGSRWLKAFTALD